MWEATSGCHGSSSVMKQWAAADNNNVFIVCVNTLIQKPKLHLIPTEHLLL